MAELTQYEELASSFWEFAFANPEFIKPTHISLYMFALEHWRRLGRKGKFGLPTSMAMEATGIKSYNAYKKHFDELVQCAAFSVVELSKNQYSSNIIALSNALSKNDKALYKAQVKHGTKHVIAIVESTGESNCSISNTKENNSNDNSSTVLSIGGVAEKKEFQPTEKQAEQFKAFVEWMERNTPDVLKMKKPITIEQFVTLRGEMPYAKKKNPDGTPALIPGVRKKTVEDTLIDLQNKTEYRKKFESPYYCIIRWNEKNSK